MKSKIGEIIEGKGLKKKYIAQKLGISQEQISRWSSGTNKPSLEKAFKLAEILECKVDDLYEIDNTEKDK